MALVRRRFLAATGAGLLADPLGLLTEARAQAPFAKAIKVGVLNDRSGPYADSTGEGAAVAARMAAAEFGDAIDGVPIQVIVGDHLNKPDVGAQIVRQWFDNEAVDVVADITNSGVGFAVVNLAAERNKIVLNNSGSSDFTGKACTATQVQWNFGGLALAQALVNALLDQKLDTWFLVGADYAFSRSFSGDLRRLLQAKGGKVLGEVFHPFGAADFSSYLLQAQASGAKCIVTTNGGTDAVNLTKQAAEFNVTQNQTLVLGTVINLSDLEALGPLVQGLLATSAFQWTRTPQSKAWSLRFRTIAGKLPTGDQAATYSAVRHYLTAVAALRSTDTAKVLAKMRDTPVDDMYTTGGQLRIDGQMVHDMYLIRGRSKDDIHEEGDYTVIVETLSGTEIYAPLSQSACPLVRKP